MNVEGMFDGTAAGYDRSRERLVPDADRMYEAVVGLLPMGREESFRVVDLGAGTGLLSAFVAETYPGARITLVDFSEKMLDVAKSRFAGEPEGRFRVLRMDYAREKLPGEYEVVMSSLSIHHLQDNDKKRVFREAHRALTDGGVFVNADQLSTASPEAGHGHHAHGEHAEGEEAASHLHHAEGNGDVALNAQLAWMEEVGFTDVQCPYRNGRFVVYGGRKEGP